MSYARFATLPAFASGKRTIPPPTRAGLGALGDSSDDVTPGDLVGTGVLAMTGDYLPFVSDYSAATFAPAPGPINAAAFTQPTGSPASAQDIAAVNNSVGNDFGTLLSAYGASSEQMQSVANGQTDPGLLLQQLQAGNTKLAAAQSMQTVPLVAPSLGPNYSPSPAAAAPGSGGFTSWLESNIWWIAIGVGVLAIAPTVIRKI